MMVQGQNLQLHCFSASHCFDLSWDAFSGVLKYAQVLLCTILIHLVSHCWNSLLHYITGCRQRTNMRCILYYIASYCIILCTYRILFAPWCQLQEFKIGRLPPGSDQIFERKLFFCQALIFLSELLTQLGDGADIKDWGHIRDGWGDTSAFFVFFCFIWFL